MASKSSSVPARMKKILVLHGYAQNGYIFSKRMAALKKQCKNSVDFVFLDAPHVLQPEDLQFDNSNKDQPPTEPPSRTDTPTPSSHAKDAPVDPLKDLNSDLRGWWTFPHKTESGEKDMGRPVGLDTSLLLLRDTVKQAKFDGVLGFSQGAAVAAMLTALLERPASASYPYPEFLLDGQLPHPKLELCICAAGFLPVFPLANAVFSLPSDSEGFETRTLHIIGTGDGIISPERAIKQGKLWKGARVEMHDGGHFLPSKTPWRKFIAAWIADPSGETEIASPEARLEPAAVSSLKADPKSETPVGV